MICISALFALVYVTNQFTNPFVGPIIRPALTPVANYESASDLFNRAYCHSLYYGLHFNMDCYRSFYFIATLENLEGPSTGFL